MEFHALLDAIPDSLTLLSRDLKVLWANRCATSGKAVSEFTDRHCYELREHRAMPCDDCPALKTFESGKTESSQNSRDDGSVWDIRAFPLRDDHGQVVSVIEIATDVTEKINLQAESSRMAHLASLGELAAGVAHEINNPINTVINCAQIMEDAGHLESDTRDDLLGRIVKEGDRVASIVSSLLSFANQNCNEKVSVPVQQILSEALALSVRQLEKDGIVIETRLPVDLPEIFANPQQIEQVFLNIINNARHALNQKFSGPHNDKVIKISGDIASIENCPCVRVVFHDRGVGIPSSIIGRVLDPFFSTKPKGQGTGLGLSISHGIVKDHGGRLVITSHANAYTKVQVSLPARLRV
jgi:signal transduction histidine kinase